MNREIFELQAGVCQMLGNAKRLEIICTLGDEELSVGDIAEKMDLRMANISQHLSIMKSKGILLSRRDGVNIYYRISNPKVVKACNLMKEVLMEQLETQRRFTKETA